MCLLPFPLVETFFSAAGADLYLVFLSRADLLWISCLLCLPPPPPLLCGGPAEVLAKVAVPKAPATPVPPAAPAPPPPPPAAAPARAVVTEDLSLRALLPHGGGRGLARAAGGLQAQRHGGRLGRPPRAERHGNGGRLRRPPGGRPATPATGRAGEARSPVLRRPRRYPAAAAAPAAPGKREAGSPGPSPAAGPPAGDAGPILRLTSRESQLWSEDGPRGGRGSGDTKA